MRQVDRGDVNEPSILDAPIRNDGRTERERNKDRLREGKKPGFTRYKHDTVKEALEALFHGKCAYCESDYAGTQPVDIEHYRPKGEVEGVPDHPGYWWLAAEWENLLPSCIDCNRKRRQKTPKAGSSSLATLAEDGDFDRQATLNSGKEASFPLASERGARFQRRRQPGGRRRRPPPD